MDLSQIEVLAASAAVIAVWMCGAARVQSLLWGLALQTGLLAAISATYGVVWNAPHYFVVALGVLTIKAVTIPVFLAWAARRLAMPRDPGTFLSSTASLLAACGVIIAGYFLAPSVAAKAMGASGAAGMALSLLLIGMLLMGTRRLAISQVVGFLTLENGIFLFGLTQSRGMPLMVEMGIVFEILVGVMVAGLVLSKLSRSFEHIGVAHKREPRP